MLSQDPNKRALIVFYLFLVFGLAGWSYFGQESSNSLALLLIYLVITINTYFSIKLFASLVSPKDWVQNSFDTLLFLIYLALAFTFGSVLWFVFLFLILFIVATAKYASLLYVLDQPRLLKRKILIDLSGALLAALVLAGILGGYERASIWMAVIVFTLANVVLLWIRPMYKTDSLS